MPVAQPVQGLPRREHGGRLEGSAGSNLIHDPGTLARADTPCPDGDVCNGDERCNGFGRCQPGTPLDTNDRNVCTSDACDAVTGVSHDPVRDGTTCSGVGVCQAGVCSVPGTVFSEDFVQFQSAPAQCDRWNDFLFNRLTDGSYGRITMLGTSIRPA